MGCTATIIVLTVLRMDQDSTLSPVSRGVKLLNNRIKKCRGCNTEFARKVDGSLPDPPLSVVVCHEENITIFSRPQNVYYANLSCIRMVNPTFSPHHLQVPADTELSEAHKNYLCEHIGCDC